MLSRLLLLSNSRAADGEYLRWPQDEIKAFLTPRISTVHFIPYAGLPATSEAYDAYANRVRAVFAEMRYELISLHESFDPAAVVLGAEAIVVGGGNTFQLLTKLYEQKLVEVIAQRVRAGTPYIGWSAGANIACPTISTTNDMPIVAPPSFRALNLVPFQINPHFTEAHPPGHEGETRAERIAEFLLLNPAVTVIGLREGALLHYENDNVRLAGTGARVFTAGAEPRDWNPGESLWQKNDGKSHG